MYSVAVTVRAVTYPQKCTYHAYTTSHDAVCKVCTAKRMLVLDWSRVYKMCLVTMLLTMKPVETVHWTRTWAKVSEVDRRNPTTTLPHQRRAHTVTRTC